MKRILVLSGPPRCGKDTCANILVAHFGAAHEKFAQPMKVALPAMLGIPFDQLEAVKDEPLGHLGLPSFRQLQIDFSEKYFKPVYGKDIFSRLLVERLRNSKGEYIVLSDCGFQEEIAYIAKQPDFTVLLVQLFRQGCTYAGDSRYRVSPTNGVEETLLQNFGTKQELETAILQIASFFYYGVPYNDDTPAKA